VPIALTTIGVLTALGLDAIVQSMHHRRQREQALRAVAEERDLDRANVAKTFGWFRAEAIAFHSDLRACEFLQKHPGTAEVWLASAIKWTTVYEPTVESVWNTARATGVVAYRNRGDVQCFDHA